MFTRLRSWIGVVFDRKRLESEMDAELQQHMAAYSDDLVRSGVSRAEAERRARIEFGSVLSVKEECRQAWGLRWMDELREDLRLTSRTLRQSPGFAATAILSLALGIGANTAIFGLVDAVILRTLPVREPDRLVFIENVGTQGRNDGPPYPCFELLRDKVESFEEVAAFSASSMELVIDGDRELARGVWVSGNFYELLGIRPLIGRTLSIIDDETIGSGGPDGPVAVISSAYWRQRFGGDPGVVGRSIQMFEQTLTIVGVMPAEAMSLEPGRPIDIAVPMMLSDPASLKQRGAWWLAVVARLKSGVHAEQARAESDVLFQAYMADLSISPEFRKRAFDHIELVSAARGMDRLRMKFSKPLTALVILAGLVLFAACANVANLMLARATARRKEFAVRLAIGAGRGRLVRQTLTEASVLVAAGSALGILLASQGAAALAAFFAEGISQIELDLSLSGRMLLFTLTVSVLTTFAFGLFPALRAAWVDPAEGLQSSSRSIGGSRLALRLGRSLVIVQVALSMVLVASAGLFIRSLQQLNSVDLGFAREGILTMEVTPEQRLSGKPEWLVKQKEILDRVRHLPGVLAASWSTMSPLSGRIQREILDVPKFTPITETDKQVHIVSVSHQYFETFSLPLLLGRVFTARDDNVAPNVAILNETAARFYFSDASPIGEMVKFPNPGRPGEAVHETNPAYEIVGVVKDAKHESVRAQAGRFIYLPIPQSFDRMKRLALAVRSTGDPTTLIAPVRSEVESGSNLLLTNVSTMEKQVERALMNERLVSALSTTFGVLGLVLACIGLYGILAYAVTRRTSEIGVRMALGATGSGIVWLVLREALALTVGGIVVGLPAVFAIGHIAGTFLYGVEPFDFPVLVCSALLLVVFAAVAGIVPARRAAALHPMSALRCE